MPYYAGLKQIKNAQMRRRPIEGLKRLRPALGTAIRARTATDTHHFPGASLNLRVIAEGVETEEQANLLRLHKCDEIQGYLFNPAAPAEQIEEFLREGKLLTG